MKNITAQWPYVKGFVASNASYTTYMNYEKVWLDK